MRVIVMGAGGVGGYFGARLLEGGCDVKFVARGAHLASLIEASPDLELLAPVPLNIVCFRFMRRNLAEDHLTELNKEILLRLQESGIAVPTYTTIKGRFAIRCSITNHRSRREDFELLIDNVIKIGKEIVQI